MNYKRKFTVYTMYIMGKLTRKFGRVQLVCFMGTFLTMVFLFMRHMHDWSGTEMAYNTYEGPPAPPQAPVNTDVVSYDKNIPLIWVGGVPRSGTTLSRAMLDAHKDIRCGEETRVIPRILGMHGQMSKSKFEMDRLKEAGITEDILQNALGAYLLTIIAQHGASAPRLCNKDPFTMRSIEKILKIFPNSKFIFMIRDGRATVHSIISRHVTIKGFNTHSYEAALRDWNRAIETMEMQCTTVGDKYCLRVHYEQLVLKPKEQMQRVLDFLGVPWDEMVIHHEKTIGKEVKLSNKELSTDQVNNPVNTAALYKWVHYIPPKVRENIDTIAPMLKKLGYDSESYPPSYGLPEEQVNQLVAGLEKPEKVEKSNVRKNKKMMDRDGKEGPLDEKIV